MFLLSMLKLCNFRAFGSSYIHMLLQQSIYKCTWRRQLGSRELHTVSAVISTVAFTLMSLSCQYVAPLQTCVNVVSFLSVLTQISSTHNLQFSQTRG